MIKIKSISKRVLAVILATLMLLTSGIVGTLAANVDIVETGATINSGAIIWYNNTNNWNTPYIHAWGSNSTTWPGVPMLYDDVSGYHYWVSNGTYTSCIFSDNGSNKTADLTIKGNGYLYNNGWGASVYSTTVPHRATTIYVDASAANWSNVYCYAWTSDSDNNTAWPGAEMTKDSATGYYKITLSKEYYYCIFNNNNGTQTGDLNIMTNGNNLFTLNSSGTDGSWSTYNPDPSYSYTISAGEGGTVNKSTGSCKASEGVEIIATANPGYNFSGWDCNNGNVDANTASTTFRPTANNATAKATFTKIAYTLSYYQSGASGTIEFGDSGPLTGVQGRRAIYYQTYDYTITAPDEYVISSLTVANSTIDSAEGEKSYNGSVSVTGDISINVTYEKVKYKITINKPEEGTVTIDPADGWVESGGTATITVTPPEGYKAFVKGAGIDAEITEATPFTTSAITSNTTIDISYESLYRQVSVVSDNADKGTVTIDGATVTPDNPVSVLAGKEVVLQIGTTDSSYRIVSIKIDGIDVGNLEDNSISFTKNFNVTDNTEITVEYGLKLVSFTVNQAEGGTVTYTPASGKTEYTGNVEITATPDANNFYVFDSWVADGITLTAEQESSAVLSLTNITESFTITPVFVKSDTGYVSTSVDYSNRGSVAPVVTTKEITLNTPYTVTATPKTGYKVTGWTVSGGTKDVDYTLTQNNNTATVTILTKGTTVSVVAHFAGIQGTVNFIAGDGGSVNKDTQVVTYDSYATAIATANEGSNFVNWAISGNLGTDYELVNCTVTSTTIYIRPLIEGVTITATANFSSGYSIDAYYLSSSTNLNKIDILEYADATTSQPVYEGVAKETVQFGDVSWNSAGTVKLTAGYTYNVTAKFYGDSPLANATGNLIMFDNSLVNWENVYVYTNANEMWRDDTNGCTTEGATGQKMTKLSGTNYYYAYVNETAHILFINQQCDGWFNLNSNQKASYVNSYSSYNSTNPMFKPDAGVDYTKNGCNYYSSGEWKSKPTTKTESGPHSMTDELYPKGVWCNEKAVWIYDNGTDVSVTFRKTLSDLVSRHATLAQSQNAYGYVESYWNAFEDAYETAKSVLGAGASTQGAIGEAATNLQTAYDNLIKNEDPNITIYATDGTITGADGYIGRISFDGYEESTATSSYALDGTAAAFYTLSVTRNTPVTIYNTLIDTDYRVAGFVINGTEFVAATAVPGEVDANNKPTKYQASYSFKSGGDVIPVYFHNDLFNDDGTLNKEKGVKVYAKYDPSKFTRWGSYISAYTWTLTDGGYKQMGIWPGQLMIPEIGQTGVYYTYVERVGTDENPVKGITFTNYGIESPVTDETSANDLANRKNDDYLINNLQRVQAYDYYEFMKLTAYDNITFNLKQQPNTNEYAVDAKITINPSEFTTYVNQNGVPMDITRATENLSEEIGLYIVRVGPKGAGTTVANDAILEGKYYVDCYIYDTDGNYRGQCKSHMLLTPDGVTLNNGKKLSDYAGKLIMVDYQGETGNTVDGDSAYRFDGEWYGYNNDAKVVIDVKAALLDKETNKYEIHTSNLAELNGFGTALINGKDRDELRLDATIKDLSASPASDDYLFDGWYIMDADGSIDIYDEPDIDVQNSSIELNFDRTYVAVFYKRPEGALIVRNFAYTHDASSLDVNKGEEFAPEDEMPHVQGGELGFSQRTVKLVIEHANGTTETVNSNTYSAQAQVVLGDKVHVTIITTPMYPNDYVYAWYEKVYDENGKVNFEEVGPGASLSHTPKQTEEYSFTINIDEASDISTYTIYSDVFHADYNVTLKYIYNNRFNEAITYYKDYELTMDEFNDNMTPSYDTLKENAPYVDDLFKNVLWKIKSSEYVKEGKVFTITADQPDTFEVNLIADGVQYDTFTKKFNESISIDAREINPEITNLQGVWFNNIDEDPLYNDGVDEILAYGSYYGFVVTGDATISYDSTANAKALGYRAILEDAIYGREQSNSADGSSSLDKIYVDYIIRYLVPKFDGEIEDDGTKLNDKVNTNATPVQFETLMDAGYTVDYGIALEYINTIGKDAGTDAQKNNFTNLYGTKKTDTAILQGLLEEMDKNAPTYGGNGSNGADGKLGTYFYIYSAKNQNNTASNKNRLLMTFKFTNNDTNCNKYFNVIAYLKLTKDGETKYVFSNQGTLNIKDIANKDASDIIFGTGTP